MKEALREAYNAFERKEVPVGAIIANSEGEIVVGYGNMNRQLNDPTAHAEILAIRAACKKLQSPFLLNCSIYVTVEPCAMCASAIAAARLKRVYYGASDAKSGGVEVGARIFDHSQTHHCPEIYSGFCEDEISTLMKRFFLNLRN